MKKAAVFLKNWRMCIPFLFLYLEIVFHLYMRLDMAYVPVFLLLAGAAGMFCAGILFFLPELPAKIVGAVIGASRKDRGSSHNCGGITSLCNRMHQQRYLAAVFSDLQRRGNCSGQ